MRKTGNVRHEHFQEISQRNRTEVSFEERWEDVKGGHVSVVKEKIILGRDRASVNPRGGAMLAMSKNTVEASMARKQCAAGT